MPNQMSELGVFGRSTFMRIEKEPSLVGSLAAETYDDIRLYDPTGMAMYHVITLPLRKVDWTFVAGGEKTTADEEAAKFAETAFDDMSHTFSDFVSDVCLMFAYGWSQFWMVLKRCNERNSKYPDGRVRFKKMEYVNPRALQEWKFDDKTGDIIGSIVNTDTGGTVLVPLTGSLYFRTLREGDMPEGVSIYKPILRVWKYRRRLEQAEGIGLSRRWHGYPILTLPEGASSITEQGNLSDEYKAQQMIQAIYDDRMMGSYLPYGWVLDFGGPGGTIDSTMGETIIRKDSEMARAVLAHFIMLGLRAVGTQALADTLLDFFITATEAYLRVIADEINQYGMKLLFSHNPWPGMTGLPQIQFSSPRLLDLRGIGVFVNLLSRAGVFSPDEGSETFLRSLIPGMPPAAEGAPQSPQMGEREPRPALGGPGAPGQEGGTTDEGVAPAELSRRHTDTGKYATEGGAAIGALTDQHSFDQRADLERWTRELADRTARKDPDTVNDDNLRQMLELAVLDMLRRFRTRATQDISKAFWMGYGETFGGPEVVEALRGEILESDWWIGYGGRGHLENFNPDGKDSFFGSINRELVLAVPVLVALLRDNKPEEVKAGVVGAVGAATMQFWRAELYGGAVWHAYHRGAQERFIHIDIPVRWVNDPLAKHCRDCASYGLAPPGREYSNWAAMVMVTGGVLPGQGTACDGGCRCHVETLGSDLTWRWA